MRISKDCVVAIEYTIRNQAGAVVDSSEGREPLIYLHGHRQIVPGVETAIDGLEAGANISVIVGPDDGYGDRDPEAVLVLPRALFADDEDLTAGTIFRALRADGRPFVFSIVESDSDRVVVDANHPLAGQTLSVDVAVLEVRLATDDELQHGHAHSHTAAPRSRDDTLPA